MDREMRMERASTRSTGRGSPWKRSLLGWPALAAIAFGSAAVTFPAAGAQRGPQTSDWPVIGGHATGDHYSKLTQINRTNVSKLKVAWTFDSREEGGLETAPIIVGRVLYAYTPSQKVIALDAATGRLIWKFDSGIAGTAPARGLAYWTEGSDGRIFAGVMNYLYALDVRTGQPIASFGENGRVDLRKGLGRDFESQSIALTTPGLIYKDLIVVGGREPETRPAPPGDIRAFDVRTGALRWQFHTIAHPGEPGFETWPKDAWKTAGAANNWAGMVLDAARGILYAPTGSPVFDFYGGDRTGDNLYADSLLALDASTGRRLWNFQGVHHDIWDRDFPSAPALLTVMRDGKRIDAVAQTTKQGYLYLFDRLSGRPLFPIEQDPYPSSDVPGEVTSATQPRPVLPKPFARQILTAEMLTNRTPQAHADALKQFIDFRSAGQFVPFALDRQTVVFPGFDGGAEWGGPAVDPVHGVLYVNANEMAWTGGLTAKKPAASLGEGLYQNECSVCHGENGSGSPPTFPSLIGIETHLSSDEIRIRIREGKGRMPAFPAFNDAKIDALLNYLRNGTHSNSEGDKEEMKAAAVLREDTSNPAGAAVYQERCAICHGDHREGIGTSFPSLLGVGTRMGAEEIADRIHKGKGSMPGFPTLDGADMAALMRFLSDVDYRFTGYRKFLDIDGYPAIAPPWGTLNAIDLNTGKYLWKIPLGEYPVLADHGITNTGSENYGGPIVTASGLLFIGATVYDRQMHAFDSSTGKLLWHATMPFAGVATPATYMIDGKQFVVIAAGGGKDHKSPSGGMYVAFSLP
jgi:quinoprotein glucose dehydrogenase